MLQQIKNSSTSTDDWPANAIPRRWIESLFEKMLFTYGAKFSDQWKGIDADGLKRHWAVTLGNLSPAGLKAGVASLDGMTWPPTLPEFVKACQIVARPAAHQFALIAPTSDLSREMAGQMLDALGASGVLKRPTTTAIDHLRWAKLIKERQRLGDKSLTLLQITFADEALTA